MSAVSRASPATEPLNSYSTGLVVGASSPSGGLVGWDAAQTKRGLAAASSYWDVGTSGLSTSETGTGESDDAMKHQATYVGWDFTNTWFIADGLGHPLLRKWLPNCASGYWSIDGTSCTDINECLTSNGGCGQNCNNTAGSFTCSCGGGYMLAADGHSCDAVTVPDAGTVADAATVAVTDAATVSVTDAATVTVTDAATVADAATVTDAATAHDSHSGCSFPLPAARRLSPLRALVLCVLCGLHPAYAWRAARDRRLAAARGLHGAAARRRRA